METERIVGLYNKDEKTKYRLYYSKDRFAIEKKADTETSWKPARCNPDERIFNIEFEPEYVLNLIKIMNDVPKSHLEIAKKYQERETAMISLLHGNNPFYELCNDSPAIGYMLGRAYGSGRLYYDEAKELAKNKRHEIIARLGLPGEKWMARWLNKINFKTYSDSTISKIMCFVQSNKSIEACRKLNLPFIDEIMTDTIRVFSHMNSYSFVRTEYNEYVKNTEEVNLTSRLYCYALLVSDIMKIGNDLGINNINKYLCECKSVEHLKRLLNRWSQKFELICIKRNGGNIYPRPPIKPTENILPIRNYKALLTESEEMVNCVKQYHLSILRNTYYIYKILSPERATLGIDIDKSGKPMIENVLLKNNNVASKQTWDMVKDWFKTNISVG